MIHMNRYTYTPFVFRFWKHALNDIQYSLFSSVWSNRFHHRNDRNNTLFEVHMVDKWVHYANGGAQEHIELKNNPIESKHISCSILLNSTHRLPKSKYTKWSFIYSVLLIQIEMGNFLLPLNQRVFLPPFFTVTFSLASDTIWLMPNTFSY